MEPCQLCSRVTKLTFHHLIPRKMHRRPRFKKHYTQEALNEGVMVCYDCHRAIHRFHDEMTLARDLHTLALLKADLALQKHIQWVSKQSVGR